MAETDSTARRPWYRRRRWSTAVALLLVALIAVGYQTISSGDGTTMVGSCPVVSHPSPTDKSSCAGVDLAGRDLRGIDLRLADLRGADLAGADLSESILYGASLVGADLRGTRLRQADLTGTDITGAKLGDTDFTDALIAGLNPARTALAAPGTSIWHEDGPYEYTLTSQSQPGIVSNSCTDREGIYYPGLNQVGCALSTGDAAGQTTSYPVSVEVKVAPTIDAPAQIDVVVGSPVSVRVGASSPYPLPQEAFSAPLPDGLTWNAEEQRLEGVPTQQAVGTHQLVFSAANGEQVEQAITIDVAPR